MIIEARPATDPALIALVAEQQAELAERYRFADAGPYPVHGDAHYLVALAADEPVGCGAIQRLSETVAEVKRMFVRPSWRGKGVGRRLLAGLEALAVERGRSVVRLETGTRQTEAIALYRSAGYRPIPVYGDYVGNPFSVCFEKALVLPVAPGG